MEALLTRALVNIAGMLAFILDRTDGTNALNLWARLILPPS